MKYSRFKLQTRMNNYYERNRKLSPLNRLEHSFLKNLYLYLTKQEAGDEFRLELYNDYIRLINVCYFPNREDISRECADVIYIQCNILLDREMVGPLTFIYLNSWNHYQKMKQVIDLIKNWSLNPLYYGHATYKELFEDMDFLRKQFNRYRIDMHADVGKWPRKFRKRFNRKDK